MINKKPQRMKKSWCGYMFSLRDIGVLTEKHVTTFIFWLYLYLRLFTSLWSVSADYAPLSLKCKHSKRSKNKKRHLLKSSFMLYFWNVFWHLQVTCSTNRIVCNAAELAIKEVVVVAGNQDAVVPGMFKTTLLRVRTFDTSSTSFSVLGSYFSLINPSRMQTQVSLM